MDVLPKQKSVKGPADWFTGDVYFDVIAPGTESRGKVNAVHFALAPAPPGTATPTARPCTSPRASASPAPATARCSGSAPATPCGARRVRSTGTAPTRSTS
jgi:hypothetical protein